jgi:hypothetical protein
MSHQHQGQSDSSRKVFYDMGYRHFAFSNYYPSAPTYPLPEAYLQQFPDVIGCPNAEHHSFTDSGLHFNALGSLLATGAGFWPRSLDAAPLVLTADNLTTFDAQNQPGSGVYRFDLALRKMEGASLNTSAYLTLTDAQECESRPPFSTKGPIQNREFNPSKSAPARQRPSCELSAVQDAKPGTTIEQSLYFRALSPTVTATLKYDPKAFQVTQYRLMQGTNRPWRDVFRSALDNLLFPDGGGITLNHPTGSFQEYATMLDFDSRVLGIEVWNVLTTGFGSPKGFYDETPGPHQHFYELWDRLLKSGRRCWGFFVKDHITYGRGRNVLLVPPQEGLSPKEREQAALRAYRNGCFFGMIAALPSNEQGEVTAPYDQSNFRFTRLSVPRGGTVEVVVGGNDATKRPNIQLRFITDQGVAKVIDGAEGTFSLPQNATFVRVEAFAYPNRVAGSPLTAEAFARLNVYEISLLHDRRAPSGSRFAGNEHHFPMPLPVVDMLFSQPLRVKS